MKSFAAFLRSPVGRLHSSYVVFILFNLLSGLIGRAGYYPVLSTVHFISGLLIVVSPAIFLIVNRNRGMILKAFARMVWFQKVDIAKLKAIPLLFKASALLVAFGTLANAVTGVLYRLGIAGPAVYPIHITVFYVLLAAIPLHAALGVSLRRAPKRKTTARPTRGVAARP